MCHVNIILVGLRVGNSGYENVSAGAIRCFVTSGCMITADLVIFQRLCDPLVLSLAVM